MNLSTIRHHLEYRGIFYAEETLGTAHTVIGYEKVFRWQWLATQLNTFIFASDVGSFPVTPLTFHKHAQLCKAYADKHYAGWPIGMQAGMAIISILISSHISKDAQVYCERLQAEKSWAGFTVPVAINADTGQRYLFHRNPAWGRIYYPYFKQLIQELTVSP